MLQNAVPATGLDAEPTSPAAHAGQGLVGVIDIGSNSIRLVVFEDGVRSPDYFFNEKTICRLGEGMGETGRLNPRGKTRAIGALKRYAALARGMGVGETLAVGTAALRDSEDGPAFRDEIELETGLKVRVATGREEATLAAEGVLFGWPGLTGVVADLGGSSLELARVRDGSVESATSVPAGHLRLIDPHSAETERALDALDAFARPFALDAGAAEEPDGEDARRLVLVGGAWRALAKTHMALESYPFNVLQGYEMTAKEARSLCAWIASETPEKVKRTAGVSSTRLSSLVAGALALDRLLDATRPSLVGVSAFGVREGLIFERMPEAMRAADPLIAAAERTEARSARRPGFGLELFEWMEPVLAEMEPARRRLAEAVCRLHDMNWRSHPDFRAAACFGAAARANLGGVGHRGRLFICAALVHRYKGADQDDEIVAAMKRLGREARAEAEVVGRAARLGAMLSGSVDGTLAHCPLSREDGRLRLTFAPEVADFAGERVEQRLKALADAMDLEAELVA